MYYKKENMQLNTKQGNSRVHVMLLAFVSVVWGESEVPPISLLPDHLYKACVCDESHKSQTGGRGK